MGEGSREPDGRQPQRDRARMRHARAPARLDRARADAELIGDFVLGVALHLLGNGDFPATRRQRHQRIGTEVDALLKNEGLASIGLVLYDPRRRQTP